MSNDSHIHEIILQLIELSHGQTVENAFLENGSQRKKHIRNLTPIKDVSKGSTLRYDPKFSFYVSKVTPKGLKYSFDDAMTLIISKEFYPHYMDMPKDEFILQFNKTIYDYIMIKFKEAKDKDVPQSDNIWIQPNAAFVSWFQEKGIEIDLQTSFYYEGDDIVDKEGDDIVDKKYLSRRGYSDAKINYIRLYILTKEYMRSNAEEQDGKNLSIRRAVKIVYRIKKTILPEWADNSLNKFYHLGENLYINK